MSNTPRTDAAVATKGPYKKEYFEKNMPVRFLAVCKLCEQLERELADSIRDHDADARRWAEVLRAQEGLTRIAEKERDQLKDKLARFETAKMSEEAVVFTVGSHQSATTEAVWKKDYDELYTFAAAQTVRAEENEHDMLRASSIGMALIISHLGAFENLTPYLQQQYKKLESFHRKCDKAFDAALKEPKT